MKPLHRRLIGTLAVIIAIAIWDTASSFHVLDPDLFPRITSILQQSFTLLTTASFWTDSIGASLIRLLIACMIVLPLSAGLGLVAGLNATLSAIIFPFFNFTLPLPKVALFPLIMALFGIGDRSKVVMIVIGMFYPLFLNVFSGTVALSKSGFQEVAKVYGLRGWALFYNFYFKGLRRDLVTGLKTSIGYGFTLVIVSEMTASDNGIGHFIWRAWESFSILDMYSGIAILCGIGWIIQSLLDLWQPHAEA